MGTSYNPPIVTDGLVFCVDAANQRSYPKSGTTWTDMIGGNNGTLTNGPTFDSANRGSIVFDGSNDHVELANSSGSEYNFSNISIGCWFKVSTTFSTSSALVSKLSNFTISEMGWYLLINGSSGALTWSPRLFSSNTPQTTEDYRDGNWHYAVATHDGTDAKIYVDGVLKVTASNSSTSNSPNSVYIGSLGFGGSLDNFIEANIASVHIYNHALSADEVRRNYEATVGRYT